MRVRLRIIRVREWRGRTREVDKRVSIALTSPERRRLTTTTVLFLFLYLVLAPETSARLLSAAQSPTSSASAAADLFA